MKKYWQKTKKGSVLAYVLILMAIMLAIGLDLIASSISQEKNAIISTSTDMAMSLAQEGVENFLYTTKFASRESDATTIEDLYPGTSCSVASGVATVSLSGGSGGTMELTFKDEEDTDPDDFISSCDTPFIEVKKVKSVGTYKNTVRAVSVPFSFLENGLLAHWKLDEASGTGTAEDSSGNSHEGTLMGDANFSSNVLELDGNGDYVEINGLLGEPPEVTLSAWIKPISVDTSGSEIISLGDRFAMRLNSLTSVRVFYSNGSFVNINVTVPSLYNDWHYIVSTIKPSDRIKIYLDGLLISNQFFSGSIVYDIGKNTFLGKHGNGSSFYDFNGQMRDVRVYDRALSANEVESLYNATNPEIVPATID